jgi:solute carrier family 45, member 1/2/4
MTGGGFSSLEHGGPATNSNKLIGVSRIYGPVSLQLPAITLGLFGVQIFWSVEMSYAPPYLVSIGLSKSSMAIVLLAGPLSGLIMQPLIGVLADSNTSRWYG